MSRTPRSPDGPGDGDGTARSAPAWVGRAGTAAVAGAVAWTATPWFRRLVLGDRPYVGTAFDVASLAGWVLMAAGLVGAHTAFRADYGRSGRVAVGTTAAGMALVAALLGRSVAAFVGAGLRAVPATGEDPAGLVLSVAAFLGLALTVAGAGLLGVALRRATGEWTPASVLLVAALAVPVLGTALRLAGALPRPVGRLLVRTNLALVPLGAAWVALGVAVRRRGPTGGAGERTGPAGDDGRW
jgi:hypothetical protein